ncbi:MAG: DoxX family membrane protein [Pseudomonadota bacterium]
MTAITATYNRIAALLGRLAPLLLPVLARLVFAGVLLGYFWSSGLTKLGPDLLTPSQGAYAQIFPRAFEAAGYDVAQLGLWPRLVVLAGTAAEFLLPLMIVLGLLTRLAALGMIGFVALQSLTDIFGHKAGPGTVGAWFDAASDAAILDQRALWLILLAVLLMKGAGALSVDALVARLGNRA